MVDEEMGQAMMGPDYALLLGAIVLAGGPIGLTAAAWERGWIPGTRQWELRRSVRRVQTMLGYPHPHRATQVRR